MLCSAGVGRTGTFITIDHVLEQREKEEVVDIAGVIQRLRQQRTKIVQTAVRSYTMHTLHHVCLCERVGGRHSMMCVPRKPLCDSVCLERAQLSVANSLCTFTTTHS